MSESGTPSPRFDHRNYPVPPVDRPNLERNNSILDPRASPNNPERPPLPVFDRPFPDEDVVDAPN